MLAEKVVNNQKELGQHLANLINADDPSPTVSKLTKDSVVAYLYELLLDGMVGYERTVENRAKQIGEAAKVEEKLNNQIGSMKFSLIPTGASQTMIDKIQNSNEYRGLLRSQLSNGVITTRQTLGILSTEANSDVNNVERVTSEASGILQTLNTTFQVIDEVGGSH